MLTRVEVVVRDDAPKDVALVMMPDGPVLVLRRMQSFPNACKQVAAVVPTAHPDAIRKLVRKHLPEALDFDVLQESTAPPSWIHGRDARPGRGRWSWKARAAAVVSGLALAAAPVAGYFWVSSQHPGPLVTGDFFQGVTAMAGFHSCEVLDADDAQCVTGHPGHVVTVSARAGDSPKPDKYLLKDSSRVGLLLSFDNAGLAADWQRQDANVSLWRFIERRGQYVMAGTEHELVHSFAGALSRYIERESTDGR